MVKNLKELSPKLFKVQICQRNEIKDFIEKWHYSGNINGCISDYCFKLTYENEIIGQAFFGRMQMQNQYKRFSENPEEVTELRRLVTLDETPRNTESYFIQKMLKHLKKNTEIKKVVSYQDQEYGHVGTIYKQSNFKYLDFRKGQKMIKLNLGNNEYKLYHDKAIRTKYKGELKPFQKRLKEALENGTQEYVETKGKHTYLYEI